MAGIHEEWRPRPFVVIMKTSNPAIRPSGQELHEVRVPAAVGPHDAKNQALAAHPNCWFVAAKEAE